ncbi:hypothetical protein [Desulfocurvus sp. DL9XJH121]
MTNPMIQRKNALRLALGLFLTLFLVSALGGCALRDALLAHGLSLPQATVRTYTLAKDPEEAMRCFPDSWPQAERRAMFGKLGQWTAQRVLSVKPTRFAGEPLAVYGKAMVVVEAADKEILQEITREDGSTQRWWYLLRDCAGQWKILALYRNSGQ